MNVTKICVKIEYRFIVDIIYVARDKGPLSSFFVNQVIILNHVKVGNFLKLWL